MQNNFGLGLSGQFCDLEAYEEAGNLIIKLLLPITTFSTRLEAFLLPLIVSMQSTKLLDISSWRINPIDLNCPQRIDVLLGVELYHLNRGLVELAGNLRTLQNTAWLGDCQ